MHGVLGNMTNLILPER